MLADITPLNNTRIRLHFSGINFERKARTTPNFLRYSITLLLRMAWTTFKDMALFLAEGGLTVGTVPCTHQGDQCIRTGSCAEWQGMSTVATHTRKWGCNNNSSGRDALHWIVPVIGNCVASSNYKFLSGETTIFSSFIIISYNPSVRMEFCSLLCFYWTVSIILHVFTTLTMHSSFSSSFIYPFTSLCLTKTLWPSRISFTYNYSPQK
jgi:hypothetical protein